MIDTLKRLLVPMTCLFAALALLAGCGDGDEGSDGGGGGGDAPSVSSDATPTEVYTTFQAALADGDADTACGLLSPEGVEQVEAASIGGTCDDWVEEVSGVLTPEFKRKMENATVNDEKIQGDTATLAVRDPVLDLPLDVELEKVDGAWLLSKLSSFV